MSKIAATDVVHDGTAGQPASEDATSDTTVLFTYLQSQSSSHSPIADTTSVPPNPSSLVQVRSRLYASLSQFID